MVLQATAHTMTAHSVCHSQGDSTVESKFSLPPTANRTGSSQPTAKYPHKQLNLVLTTTLLRQVQHQASASMRQNTNLSKYILPLIVTCFDNTFK